MAVGADPGKAALSRKFQAAAGQSRREPTAWAQRTLRVRVRGPSRLNHAVWTVPLALAAAMALLPSDGSKVDALLAPAWVLCLGLLAPLIIDIAASGIERLFRAEHILSVALIVVLFAEVLQPGYSSHLSDETIAKVFLAAGAFATAVAVGSSLRPPRLSAGIITLATRQYSPATLFRVLLCCWALAMLNFAGASGFSPQVMWAGLLGGRWDAPWNRGQLGGWDAFRDFLTNFGHLVPVFTVLLAIKMGSWLRYQVITGVLCSGIVLAFVAQGGGRRNIVVILGAALITWAIFKRNDLRPEHYVVIVLVVLVTMAFLEVMLQNRNVGLNSLRSEEKDNPITGLHVDDNFHSLGEMLRVMPSEANYVGFQYVFYLLVRPVPRVLWENKPVTPGFDLAQHLGTPYLSLSITNIGEQYMSFGWPGIVLGGVFLGWLARLWSQLIETDYGLAGTAFYSLGAMALFLGIRSLYELILTSYPLLCWYALDRISKGNRRAARLQPRA